MFFYLTGNPYFGDLSVNSLSLEDSVKTMRFSRVYGGLKETTDVLKTHFEVHMGGSFSDLEKDLTGSSLVEG